LLWISLLPKSRSCFAPFMVVSWLNWSSEAALEVINAEIHLFPFWHFRKNMTTTCHLVTSRIAHNTGPSIVDYCVIWIYQESTSNDSIIAIDRILPIHISTSPQSIDSPSFQAVLRWIWAKAPNLCIKSRQQPSSLTTTPFLHGSV
jgi:hypothetical protein